MDHRGAQGVVSSARYEPGSASWQGNRHFAEYGPASQTTEGKAVRRYGRIEVRAKLPTGT